MQKQDTWFCVTLATNDKGVTCVRSILLGNSKTREEAIAYRASQIGLPPDEFKTYLPLSQLVTMEWLHGGPFKPVKPHL